MRRAVLLCGAAVLAIGPTLIAFFAGGYYDKPRLVGAGVAWLLVLVAAVLSPRPLPTSWPGRAALGGLVLIWLWTALSLTWAPLGGTATDSVTRLLLYVGALLAACALLRDHRSVRVAEGLFAFGSVAVIGYGLVGRLVPGIVDLSRSAKAGGRLEQPITYWNAEGALAAMGLVLCARLAGDGSRPVQVRALAAACCAPLGLGVYLSYSRGAIVAAAVGLVVLLAASPTWSQLRSTGVALVAGSVAALCSTGFPGVASLEGTLAERETDGAAMLAILVALMLAAYVSQAWMANAERRHAIAAFPAGIARRLPVIAAVMVALALAGLVAGGLGERGGTERLSAQGGAGRLTSVKSRRYDYWRIGLQTFADHPLKGAGPGGFAVAWLRERPVDEGALQVHSLPLEMAAELGIPGLLGLALFIVGTGAAARRALRSRPGLAAGSCAAVTVWLLHASIDWDWQLPAVTLPALIMAGALIAISEGPPEQPGRRTSPPARSHAPVPPAPAAPVPG